MYICIIFLGEELIYKNPKKKQKKAEKGRRGMEITEWDDKSKRRVYMR